MDYHDGLAIGRSREFEQRPHKGDLTWAVGSPGALICIGGSGDIDVQLIGQQAFEDAARFAGFHIEHKICKAPAGMKWHEFKSLLSHGDLSSQYQHAGCSPH